MTAAPTRLAVIASHPVQYVVPLYQRLARRPDLRIRVFYTWHAGAAAVEDRGFRARFAWDLPLTGGYDFELVPNTARDPGPYRFFGLRNPGLAATVLAWRPDVVLVNGWAWSSHLRALRALSKSGICTLFGGDSHLLDVAPPPPRALLKRALLRRVFRWPRGFLAVGSANRAYFEHFGVDRSRLHLCPHTVDVDRFASGGERLEGEAAAWRRDLGISPRQTVILFAGKFEAKKRPLELMRIVQQLTNPAAVLVLVGSGALQRQIEAVAATAPQRFRIVPFQNQSRMPLVYRLGDIFVLPSSSGESWGLAVNEAMSCGRPVIVSDRCGCAADLVDPRCGRVFPSDDLGKLGEAIAELADDPELRGKMGRAAAARARSFDMAAAERNMVAAIERFRADDTGSPSLAA